MKKLNYDVLERIQEYLEAGGFFNPELMDDVKVRDMILDCRYELIRLRKKLKKRK